MIDMRRQLALLTPWWMWKKPLVEETLAAIKLRHWTSRVRGALAKNSKAGLLPATMKDLHEHCFLARNGRNVGKLFEGSHDFSNQTLLGMAVSLKIPAREFLPTEKFWIAQAAMQLTKGAMTTQEGELLAEYCVRRRVARLSHDASTDLDRHLLNEISRDLAIVPRELESAICEAAEKLGTVLELIFDDTTY